MDTIRKHPLSLETGERIGFMRYVGSEQSDPMTHLKQTLWGVVSA